MLFSGWMTSIHFLPWNSWHNEVPAFASVVLLFGTLVKWQTNRGCAPVLLPHVAWPLVLLCVVVVLQAAIGQIAFLGDAVVLCFYFALCLFSLSVGYAAFSLGEQGTASRTSIVQALAVLIVLGGMFSVIAALVQTLDVWDFHGWIVPLQNQRRPGGNMAQPNQLATLILFALASVVYLFESQRLHAALTSLITLVLLCGLALTESRSGVLSLLLLAVWWLSKRTRLGTTLSVGVAVLWVVLFACCFWFWPSCFNFIQEAGWAGFADTPHATFEQVNTSVGTRLIVWPQLWAAAWMHPWFGWGLREVSTAHNAVVHQYTQTEAFAYAHNIGLDLAVGVGLPLTVLLICATGVWFGRRARAVNDLQSWYCIAVVLPFGVHSMLEYPFAYAYLLVPVMILVGVLEAKLAPRNVARLPSLLAASVWVLVSFAMAWSVFEYIAIEEDFRIVRFESLHLGQTPAGYERPHVLMLTQLEALLDAGRIVPAPHMDRERIELARKVALRFPWPATQNRYALSLALNGNPEEARRQLKVMRVMHGEKTYQSIMGNWSALGNSKYPQLREFVAP